MRAAVAALALGLAVTATGAGARADSTIVPLGLQVQLVSKVADYDKTLPGRESGVVRVLVVERAAAPESASAAAHALNALSNIDRIAGLPHEDALVEFSDAAALASVCRARGASILFVTPGLADAYESIAAALVGVPVLSVSATVSGVAKGIVLGFDLVGGKPKLFVSLSATRKQGVRLSPDVLKIATVIE